MKRVISVSLLLCLLILITACAPGSIGFRAQIYQVWTDYDNSLKDMYTYIKSVNELEAYYEANNKDDGLKNMKEKVLDNKRYNDEFFKDNCLLIIDHVNAYPFDPGHKVRSVVFKDDVIDIDIFKGKDVPSGEVVREYHIVIELGSKYADKEVKTTYS